jgi:glycosyltransferase involved in cell wall biosynthesis
MQALGHDVTMLPLYSPIRLDEESVSEERVFFGGIEAYLLQRFTRKTAWRDALLKLAGSQALLRLLPRFDIGSAVDARANAELTVSMLRGADGHQASLLDELAGWLADLKPDLIHLTNALISGLASGIKKALQVPVVCGLLGEDIFLDELPEPHQRQAYDLVRDNAAAIDQFVTVSRYYAEAFAPRLGLDPGRVSVVPPGIALGDYPDPFPRPARDPLTVGYLARLAPEKGLHVLIEAFILLCRSGEFPDLRLRAAGYLSRSYAPYLAGVRRRVKAAGLAGRVEILGTVERTEKLAFLKSLDVFSVPAVYRDPKGLPALEAMASGVPVVQPEHGAYPELIQAAGGGLLHRPEDAADLAEKLARLLRDPGLREELGRQGRTAVVRQFSAEHMAAETLEVYRRVLGKWAESP